MTDESLLTEYKHQCNLLKGYKSGRANIDGDMIYFEKTTVTAIEGLTDEIKRRNLQIPVHSGKMLFMMKTSFIDAFKTFIKIILICSFIFLMAYLLLPQSFRDMVDNYFK